MEQKKFNPLNAELNPICHLLALLGGATIVVISRLRVNLKKINFAAYWIPLLFTVFCVKGKVMPIQAWTGQKVPGG